MAKGKEPRIKTVEDRNIERVKEMLAKLAEEHEFKSAMFVGLDKDGQIIKCSEGGGLFDLIGMLEFAKMTLLNEFHVAE
jgi:hypothetical protein